MGRKLSLGLRVTVNSERQLMLQSASAGDGGHTVLDLADGEERYLATRAAWLYYHSGLKQAGVARALGVSLNKANRLLAAAQENGVVRVTVEGPIAGCIGLEDQIRRRFNLELVRVVPDFSSHAFSADAVGRATASVLVAAIEQGRHRVFGIGHGRALAAAGACLPLMQASGVEFVSLLGCAPYSDRARPLDLVRVLGERTGGGVRLMPAPVYARTLADLAVILRQSSVLAALEAACSSTFLLSGISSVAASEESLVRSGVLHRAEIASARNAGAVSVFLGRFLDERGRLVRASLNRRVVGLSWAEASQRETIGVAEGGPRSNAVLSVLRAGLLKGLVTTEAEARDLLTSA